MRRSRFASNVLGCGHWAGEGSAGRAPAERPRSAARRRLSSDGRFRSRDGDGGLLACEPRSGRALARRRSLAEDRRGARRGGLGDGLRAREASEARVPESPELAELWPRIAWRVTIPSEPPGATVFWQAYDAPDDRWHELGKTPLEDIRFPYGLSRLRFELAGHRTLMRALGGAHLNWTRAHRWAADIALFDTLLGGPRVRTRSTPAQTLARDKVRVPGWTLGAGGRSVELRDYFLGRYEVTNAEYKAVRGRRRLRAAESWDPIVVNGAALPWESDAAVRRSDRTTGPKHLGSERLPDGEDGFPVSGVSWYEAAAYARFVGQELPTAHHWQHALANSMFPWLLPASNFGGTEPRPVDGQPGDDARRGVRHGRQRAGMDGDARSATNASSLAGAGTTRTTSPAAPTHRRRRAIARPATGCRLAVTARRVERRRVGAGAARIALDGVARARSRSRSPTRCTRRTAACSTTTRRIVERSRGSDRTRRAFGRASASGSTQGTARSACCSTSTCRPARLAAVSDRGLLAGLGYVRARRRRRVLRETDRLHREERTSRCVPRVQGDLRARVGNSRVGRDFDTVEYRDNTIDTVKDLRRRVDYLETRGDSTATRSRSSATAGAA